MITLEIKTIGNSAGVILPKEALSFLHAKQGDTLYLIETPEGLLLRPYSPELVRQMEAAEDIMREDRQVLHELAK